MPTLTTPTFSLNSVITYWDSETWTINPGVIAQSSEDTAVYSQIAQSELVNYGAIISIAQNRDGVEFYGDDSVITNFGLITGDKNGIFLDGDTETVTNAGQIHGKHGAGIEFFWDAKFVTINNTGTISGGEEGIYADSDVDGGTINNHGLIHGDAYGIFVNHAGSWLTAIENYGTIEGGDSIRAKAGGVHLENHGTMSGGLRFTDSGQHDEVINSGKIVGNVSLGGGDDFFDGTDGVSGGIFGGGGNDRLIGGSFADKLDGGLGKDTLTGGGGADRFDFNSLADSQVGANRDVITSFSHAQHDRIDLADVYAYTLDFIGTGAFTHAGQVRYVLENHAGTAHDRTMIYVNTDADQAPEMQIQVNHLVNFVAGDFVL